MNRTALYLVTGLFVGAVGFCADDVWNTREPSQWSGQDIDRILNDSPWSKSVTVSTGAPMGQQRGNRRMGAGFPGGGVGFPGGGYPGGGYPGGGYPGGGYPGGGYPRGGGYPSGDPNGGGYPQGGGGRYPGGPSSYNVTVRWESAYPVKEAMQLSKAGGQPAESEKAANAGSSEQQQYVIGVLGLPVVVDAVPTGAPIPILRTAMTTP